MSTMSTSTTQPVDLELGRELYRQMYLIRRFEKRAINLIVRDEIRIGIHPCTGQEAVSVGSCSVLDPTDAIFFTYRGHGHALAKGLPAEAGFAELMGRSTGCCAGWGGSMLFADFERGIMGGNSVVAGSVPIAVGRAVAARHRGEPTVVLSFFGDGATNQGTWHEALVLATMWKAPVVFICENNQYSEMTPITHTVPLDNLADRAAAYPMPGVVIDGNDVEAVREAVATAVSLAREGGGPSLLEMKTFRFDGHYYGDAQEYIPQEIQEYWRARDPIPGYRQVLEDRGVAPHELDNIQEQVEHDLDAAIATAKSAPLPTPDDLARVEGPTR